MPTLYRFLPATAALRSLDSTALLTSQPAKLNDPFDCRPEFIDHGTRTEEEKVRLAQIFLARRSEMFGVLCFSRRWNHHLMWSHYADHHRGIALVLSLPDAPQLHQIKYRRKRAVVDLDDIDVGGRHSVTGFEESFVIKPLAWRYELETRIVTRTEDLRNEEGRHFHIFGTDVFQGAILGLRCEVSAAELRGIFQRRQLAHGHIWRVKSVPGNFTLSRRLLD
jgi:hypothetical protein